MMKLNHDTFWDFKRFHRNTSSKLRPLHWALYHKGLFLVCLYNLEHRHQFNFSFINVKGTIFCMIRMAFFLTKSVVCWVSLTTASTIPLAIVLFMIFPRAVKQMTTSWTSVEFKSFRIVETNMINKSDYFVKNSEHIK